jgi:hypothetical protein
MFVAKLMEEEEEEEEEEELGKGRVERGVARQVIN